MGEMKKDRENLTWKEKYEKEHKLRQEAEGETTIVKGIGINSPEMRGLQTELKNLKNSLGDAADKLTVLQLKCDRYEIMRLTVLKSLQEMRDIIDEKEKK